MSSDCLAPALKSATARVNALTSPCMSPSLGQQSSAVRARSVENKKSLRH
jgi:hypothetical protein